MRRNNNVPERQAQRIRTLMKIEEKIPVRFATGEKSFEYNAQDRKNSKRGSLDSCLNANCLKRNGHPCLVALRKTAMLQHDRKGRKMIGLYANDEYAYKQAEDYDRTGKKGKGNMEIILRAWPVSWRPEERRMMRKKRQAKMKRLGSRYVKRAYTKRKVKNTLGVKRATF